VGVDAQLLLVLSTSLIVVFWFCFSLCADGFGSVCGGLWQVYPGDTWATCMLCIPAARFMMPSAWASVVIRMAVHGEYLLWSLNKSV